MPPAASASDRRLSPCATSRARRRARPPWLVPPLLVHAVSPQQAEACSIHRHLSPPQHTTRRWKDREDSEGARSTARLWYLGLTRAARVSLPPLQLAVWPFAL
ncbi:uncharacterized protein SCHCODRAFT_02605073 [Schizophyllum commune H4-8]|uniref:uncharacterized protein n=1 Tax=Schizophyllum commune (strain H4-8 / FGSC 9210) TaxID=578458 RepID=UPI00215E7E3D|nr:uncharacterized protein SCHCODRAFT_02605073 [Schizophyllum commune H4-8]KAI5899412.1 hypothetical protein SCHCODRAFT_02605073 [Schizophyllum commune H4-8]